jgi:hypothetical protein
MAKWSTSGVAARMRYDHGLRGTLRANRDYFRTRGGEAEMPEMWEQEGLGCAGSRLRGDIKKELRARWIAARASLSGTSRPFQRPGAGCRRR